MARGNINVKLFNVKIIHLIRLWHLYSYRFQNNNDAGEKVKKKNWKKRKKLTEGLSLLIWNNNIEYLKINAVKKSFRGDLKIIYGRVCSWNEQILGIDFAFIIL